MATKKFQTELTGMQNNMFNFAMLLTSNESAAYDLTQDTTLLAIEHESEYTEGVSMKNWLFTLMRNIFIANYRNKIPVAALLDTGVQPFQVDLMQEAGLESPEGSHTVQEMTVYMSTLADGDRQAFSLYAAGYTLNEISDRLSMPVSAVRKSVARAGKGL